MKLKIFQIITFLFLTTGTFAQDSLMTLEYEGNMQLNTPIKTGTILIFKQFCSPLIDSVVKSGYISFGSVNFNDKVLTNKIRFIVENDTLIHTTVDVKGKKEIENFTKLLTDEFGTSYKLNGKKNKKICKKKSNLSLQNNTYIWEIISPLGVETIYEYTIQNKEATLWGYIKNKKKYLNQYLKR